MRRPMSWIAVFSLFLLAACGGGEDKTIIVNGQNQGGEEEQGVTPTTPSALAVFQVANAGLRLEWTDNSDLEAGFEIERSLVETEGFAQVSTALANVCTFIDNGLSEATKYYYRVRAYNGAGESGYSNTASALTNRMEHVLGDTYTEPVTGMQFVWIPPGTFTMGNFSFDETSNPAHQVTLTKGFWMGIYEVTIEFWFPIMHGMQALDYNTPMLGITWQDTQDFIANLNALTGKNFRLPTEAEWEYAARCGGQDTLYSGTDNINDLANHAWWAGLDSVTFPPQFVGKKYPNAWGLFDMSGNVWEWVQDYYEIYGLNPLTDPVGPRGGYFRILRGGSYNSPIATELLTTYRMQIQYDHWDPYAGLRLVMDE